MSTPLLACRSCGSPVTRTFADLGTMPLANDYPEASSDPVAEERYPLHAGVCNRCLLVQVPAVVPPERIFSDYAYFSSYSVSWVEHARRFAVTALARFGLDRSSLVVEVASNDGYLLRHFVDAEIPVLGVEPAANVAEVAVAAGVPTEVRFFGRAAAEDLVASHGRADLVVANNVLAHVPDLNDFVAGLAVLMGPAGAASIEFPHLLHLVQKVQFDTIYHEHFSYFSLHAVEPVFERQGLRVVDVEQIPTHGGSLRVTVRHAAAADTAGTDAGLAEIRSMERAAGLHKIDTYLAFEDDVRRCRASLLELLHEERRHGRRVAAYGAAAKGNTLLNYCGVTPDLVTMVADRSPHKQGRLLPGSRIPIVSPEDLLAWSPDVVLILPWNLAGEIIGQLRSEVPPSLRFVVAVPRARALS